MEIHGKYGDTFPGNSHIHNTTGSQVVAFFLNSTFPQTFFYRKLKTLKVVSYDAPNILQIIKFLNNSNQLRDAVKDSVLFQLFNE